MGHLLILGAASCPKLDELELIAMFVPMVPRVLSGHYKWLLKNLAIFSTDEWQTLRNETRQGPSCRV